MAANSKALELLDATAHTWQNLRGQGLDWPAMPAPFKAYPRDVRMVPLPRPEGWPAISCAEVFAGSAAPANVPNAAAVSALAQLACGVTAVVRRTVDEFHLRANASAGALYPCELYLAAQGVEGLPDGLFHFAVQRHALGLLRRGQILADGPGLRAWLTVIPFRSAWKYRDRAVRYLFLDAGHVLENLDGAARALGLSCRVDISANARETAGLLGIAPERERCLVEIELLGNADLASELPPPVHAGLARASTVSPREVEYPLITQALDLSSPGKSRDAAASLPDKRTAPAPLLERPFVQAVLHRRSRRSYMAGPLPSGALDALAVALSNPAGASCGLGVGFVVGGDESAPGGFHLLDRESGTLGASVFAVDRKKFTEACLDQAWMTKAAVLVCFFAAPDDAEAAHGPNALKRLLIQAGRLGQRIYLCAAALGLGACGVGAFIDEDARRTLGLAASERLLYVVAFGPVRGVVD